MHCYDPSVASNPNDKGKNIIFIEVDEEDSKLTAERFPDATIIDHPLQGDELVEACKDFEVISTFIYSKFTADVIKKLKNLKLLCTRSVGFNHIDADACKKQKITVCNVPDYGSHVIAEHVFALLLSTIRHIPTANARVESGEFDYHGLRGMALRGDTIGIIGVGKIGERVARIAHGFGMHILGLDNRHKKELMEEQQVKYVSLEELLEKSDIITLHVPATDDTHHMIDDVALHRMKKDVVIINTARGELIDSQALVSAIKGGKVKYALLDVMEHEKNFEENRELIEFPNVITTPHIAFYADESMKNMYIDCFESIESWIKGDEPRHVIKQRTIVKAK